jgi:hypothetical protein
MYIDYIYINTDSQAPNNMARNAEFEHERVDSSFIPSA